MKAFMNGKEVDFKEGESILEVARRNSFRIPTLCEMTEMDHTPATCRVCLVRITSYNVCYTKLLRRKVLRRSAS